MATQLTDLGDKNPLPELKTEEELDPTEKKKKKSELLYGVEDCPPWYTCLALGLQHFFMMIESTVSIPYILTPLMCMAPTDPTRGLIASTIVFVSGLVTIMQTTLGVRLPIIQGGTHTFLGPTLAILSLMPCPSESEFDSLSPEEKEQEWKLRMNQLQGAICVAALFQVFVGFTGIVGLLMRWITPLVITPTITLIGLSLVKVTTSKAADHWGVASFTVFLLVLFSQYLRDVKVPIATLSSAKKITIMRYEVFKLFPVLLTLILSWLLCFILTVTDSLDKSSQARTDVRLDIIDEAPWFRVPYPGQWGTPTLSVAAVMGILAGVLASIVESIGDYFACARLAGAPPPPAHALNRGIGVEGLGTVLAGLFGSGNGTTSYSQNVAAIAVTKVGSRRVILYAAGIMILCGLVGKFGALAITIPEPIIGGIFFVIFSMITAVGLSSLQFVDLNSSRNLFVLGFSIFSGVAIPNWMQLEENQNVIHTTLPILDQVLSVLLKTPMFVAGFLGFVLDNTVPGTKEERGLVAWEKELAYATVKEVDGKAPSQSCYDLPFGNAALHKWKWARMVPVSPSFTGWKIRRKASNENP